MNFRISTCNHLGDALCLSAALANAKIALPAAKFIYEGNYKEVFFGSAFEDDGSAADRSIRCNYRDHGARDHNAQTGSLCQGLTVALGKHLGVNIPYVHKAPGINLTESEKAWGTSSPANGAIILNTNCQQKSSVKGYPWWDMVTRLLPGKKFVLIGSKEERDIRFDGIFGDNVVDFRGKTSCRQLFAMVYASDGVLSPPSSCCHVAGAFGKPMVIVSGAREPVALTDYPSATHIHSVCVGTRGHYDLHKGCMHFVTTDERSCERPIVFDGRQYASCMACIPPEAIAEKILSCCV